MAGAGAGLLESYAYEIRTITMMSLGKIALCGLLLKLPCNVLGFDVAGEVSYSGTLSNNFTKSFKLSVDNCQWSISTWKTNFDGTQRTVASAVYDGTNVHMIHQFGKRPLAVGRPRVEGGAFKIPSEIRKEATAKNQGAVTVIPGMVPEFDSSFIAPLWLMFASGCLSDELRKDALKPMWASGSGLSTESVKTDWGRNPNPPYLPVRVMFRSKANGAFKALFEASAFQTVGDLTYPTFARLTQFITDSAVKSENDLKMLTVMEVKVREFSANKPFQPVAVPTNSVVTDRRLRLGDSNDSIAFFSYLTTNGIVAAPNVAKQSTRYKLEAALHRAGKESHHLSRYLVLAVIASTFFVLGAFLYSYFRKRDASRKQNPMKGKNK